MNLYFIINCGLLRTLNGAKLSQQLHLKIYERSLRLNPGFGIYS